MSGRGGDLHDLATRLVLAMVGAAAVTVGALGIFVGWLIWG